MKVLGLALLENFKRRHSDARGPVDAWLAEARRASWRKPQDIKDRYRHSSFLKDHVVVFNIKGNRYRLAVRMSYPLQIARVLRAGTHEEYDSWGLQ